MTFFGYYVALIIGTGLGAIGMDFIGRRRIAELEAENAELRQLGALDDDESLERSLAALKTALNEEHAA